MMDEMSTDALELRHPFPSAGAGAIEQLPFAQWLPHTRKLTQEHTYK